MSKAKSQAYQNGQACYPPSSSAGFATGFLLGQLTLALILFVFIKFFIFGEAPSADERAETRAAARRQRTLSYAASTPRQRALSSVLRPRPSSAVLQRQRASDGGLTVQKILEKTYYNVQGHQPESLDWFNVLIAQTTAQLRADALEDEAVLTSLTALLNGPSKPDFIDEIRVTEISLGDEFPIFSNCRVIPVDENGSPLKELKGNRGEMLQARMDVDLSDVVTLGIETKLVLNYPRPFVAVLPVALAVSIMRFSGTLSLSFSPSSQPNTSTSDVATEADNVDPASQKNEGHPLNPTGQSPTNLTFTFLDDYRLDLSVHSLIGSRSRLQDVPKIAQLVESRIHAWFDERCVEPRFQQIVLPSLWPRKKTTRGGDTTVASTDAGDDDDDDDGLTTSAMDPLPAVPNPTSDPRSRKDVVRPAESGPTSGPDVTAEQRTRAWAARMQHTTPKGKKKETAAAPAAAPAPTGPQSELELAGADMREADERARRKELHRQKTDLKRQDSGLRMRNPGVGASS